MSSTEITLTCDHEGCTETFETGRSLWQDAAIEGREAGWETGLEFDLCPEHRNPDHAAGESDTAELDELLADMEPALFTDSHYGDMFRNGHSRKTLAAHLLDAGYRKAVL